MRSPSKTFLFRITSILLFCSLFVVQSKAQEREKLIFENYTIKDGLPSNWIKSIDQDSYGYLWIGTDAGISRYDGFRFQNYFNDPADSSSLMSNDINQILVDNNQQIWISSSIGIDRFDRKNETFDHFRNDPDDPGSLPSDQVLSLFESSDSTLWVGTSNGLARYDPLNQNFTVFKNDSTDPSSLPSNFISALAESADKKIWIGTEEGLVIYDPVLNTFKRYQKDPDDPLEIQHDFISNLFIDNDQVLWVSNTPDNLTVATDAYRTVWNLNLKTGQKSDVQFDVNPYLISDFTQDHKGIIWLGILGGLGNSLKRIDPLSGTVHTYIYENNNPSSLAWSYIGAVFEDSNNILWVGTSRGLSKADRGRLQLNSFAPVPENPFDLENNIYGITEVKNNLFWFTSDGPRSYSWNRNTGEVKIIPYSGSYGTDYSQASGPAEEIGVPDGNGSVWYISEENTLNSIDINTYESKEYLIVPEEIEGFQVNTLIHGPDNNLYILTSEGLFDFNIGELKATKLSALEQSPGEEKNLYSGLLYSPDGNIWLISNLKQVSENNFRTEITLARFDLDTQQIEIIPKNASYLSALGHGSATHMMQDKSVNLWISKSNGLARFDPKSGNAQFYDKSTGLPYLSVIGSMEGIDGNIWISLSNGIARLDPGTGKVRNFTKDDGLLPSRMNLYSMFEREYGELMFGGVGGINFFHPSDITETTGKPRVLITEINAGDNTDRIDPGNETGTPFKVKWEDNTLDISYSAITFQSPELITYEYQLEGFNEEWVSVSNRNFLQFTNLPPDTYTFNVRAVNGEGIRSETASVSIQILPPWWRTWGAYASYSLIFVGFIFGVDRFQRKRLAEQEQERSREKELAQAKEIEKAYTHLKEAQQQLVQQEKLASLGQLTAGIAHEIKNPLNFVNNFSDLSVEMVQDLKDEIGTDGNLSDEQLQEINEILNDIEGNLKKINEHGSRADNIVKSMLLHSRGGSGTLEPVDLNDLIKEYVNLSFHGMRSGKDPINVDIDLQLDDSIGEIPLIAEDFSRVILNLCNNAFDALREKAKVKSEKKNGFKPELSVRTKKENRFIQIEIEDNGRGIPKEIKDKIMDPFFTTKKGTEGTGLGLSISNDIIKAHGGDLTVEDSDKQGSKFIIQLKASV